MYKREIAVKKEKLPIVVTVAGGDGKFQPTRKVTFKSLSADLYQEPYVPDKYHARCFGNTRRQYIINDLWPQGIFSLIGNSCDM